MIELLAMVGKVAVLFGVLYLFGCAVVYMLDAGPH